MKKWIDRNVLELESQKKIYSVLAVLSLIEGIVLTVLSMYVYQETSLVVLPIFGLIFGALNYLFCLDSLNSRQKNDLLIMLKRIEEKL